MAKLTDFITLADGGKAFTYGAVGGVQIYKLYPINNLEDLVYYGGAFAFELDGTGEILAAGFSAGEDLFGILRTWTTPAVVARVITNSENGPHNDLTCVHPGKHGISHRFYGALDADNTGDAVLWRQVPSVLNPDYRLFGVKVAIANGRSRGRVSVSHVPGSMTLCHKQSIPPGFQLVNASGFLSMGTIRVPGGRSWAYRVYEYLKAIVDKAPSEASSKVIEAAQTAQARAHAMLVSRGIDPAASLDIYLPYVVLGDYSVAYVPIGRPAAHRLLDASTKTVGSICDYGILVPTIGSVHGGRWMTALPKVSPVTGVGSAGSVSADGRNSGYRSSLPWGTQIGQVQFNDQLASFPKLKSIDGVPVEYFLGGFLINRPAGVAGVGAELTSDQIWNTLISSSQPVGGSDAPGQDANVTDEAYAAQLQGLIDSAPDGGTDSISYTNWDGGRLGVGYFLFVMESCCYPSKVKAFEEYRFRPPLNLVSGTSAAFNATPAGYDNLLHSDTSKCFTKL